MVTISAACRPPPRGDGASRVFSLDLGLLLFGALIALVDASPGWDDTGVSAAMLLSASGLVGALHPARAWLWGFAVGVWIPLLGIALHGSATLIVGVILPLALALGGAYAGAFVGKRLDRVTTPPKSVYEDSSSHRCLSHRVLALRADSELSFGWHLRCMGLPPLLPSSLPSATAAGFFSSAMQ